MRATFYPCARSPIEHPPTGCPADALRRNLDAVRTGAMVHDPGSDRELLRLRLIRYNNVGWYDLTPEGRAELDRLR